MKAASRGVVPAESQNHTQTVVWPRKEEAAEDKRWVTADVAQGRELALNPRTEQQNYKSDPQEHPCGDQKEQCQRSTYENGCTSEVPFFLGNGELRAQDANEAVWKDHCYCGLSVTRLWHRGPWPCPPTDHNYCRPQALGSAVLKEHGYCRLQRTCFGARVGNVARLGSKARAVLHRLATRRAQIGQIIRKAKRIMWRCNSYISRRLGVARGSSSTGCPAPAVPDGKAEPVPVEGRAGALSSPAKHEAELPLSQGRSSSPEALCAPVASPAPLPAPPPAEAAVVASSKVLPPEVSPHSEEQPIGSPGVNHNPGRGHNPAHSDRIPLHTAYKTLMRTVDHVFGSVCHKFELSSYARHMDTWPFVIRMDS